MQFERLKSAEDTSDTGASGDRYIVRLESGEPVMEMLTAFMQAIGVGFAYIGAIGAVRWARLGYWNPQTKEYEFRDFDEQLEVLSLQGDCSQKDGEPFLHIHCVLGRRDFSTIGGHLNEARVHPTLEVWIRTESAQVSRGPDPASGLDLLDLKGRA
ncbi:MAG TPA: PPC domain-containing DNA-binding protein [Chloroflexia bacterium]|jgi:hypothetical protein